QRRKPTRWVWILPAIFAVWTNLHPGMLLGLSFVGIALVSDLKNWRRWALVFLACVLACMIHPQGLRVFLFPIHAIFGGDFAMYKQYIYEFRQTTELMNTHSKWHLLCYFVLLGATGILVIRNLFFRRERGIFAFLLFGELTYLGLSSQRYLTTAA